MGRTLSGAGHCLCPSVPVAQRRSLSWWSGWIHSYQPPPVTPCKNFWATHADNGWPL